MYYIYCYTNKVNNHKYVGQTNNLERRIREHRGASINPNSNSYNHLIHAKIRQYGEQQFNIQVLEKLYTDDIQVVNERERFWINKLNTFRGSGQGYNSDLGGGRKQKSSILSEEQLLQIKQDIKKGISYLDLENKYNISASFISSINHGVYFKDEKQSYPLYQYFKSDADYDELIQLLLNSEYSLKEISEILNMGYSTVKKINAGTLRKGLYPTYPIRKKSVREIRADNIKRLLTTTTLSNLKIAQMVNSSEETVRRINVGQTFKDEKFSYPIRNL